MVLSAHQPAYLPWLGYFYKIVKSDVFIFLDSVQYEKNSYINRNRIKTSQGYVWLTIPVKTKGHLSQTLKDTEIDYIQNWKHKHLKTIYYNYQKASNFRRLYPKLEKLYEKDYPLLSDLCFNHLNFWLEELKIKTKIVRSSRLSINSKKSDLIFDLCKHYTANHYIAGRFGKEYLEEFKFKNAGILIEYQEYQYIEYSQLYGNFMPNLGVIDFCMNMDHKKFF